MSTPRKTRGRPEHVRNAVRRALKDKKSGSSVVITGGGRPRKVSVTWSVEAISKPKNPKGKKR